MKTLGTVLHTSSHKNLIVRGDENNNKNTLLPRMNNVVMNRKMKKLGKVNDVFGPVDQPYFSVRLFSNVANEELLKLKHKHVYVR
ncbi:MAG: Gar1/Naf1 family protein [Methanosarcinales archaeon]|nr:Gar1/Naf1 family protein [ANME-2 cluster archaeon]MDF1531067.1 Gar1/Naf1 family protein [ANME-2 cluster archaeon]MDW7775522.1 Gar1/Naf1 family protein [Methanosarcinales archaeon]